MEINQQTLIDGLKLIHSRGKLDYAPVSRQLEAGINLETFLALRAKGYIAMDPEEAAIKFHPLFRPFYIDPINTYKITPKGRYHLKK